MNPSEEVVLANTAAHLDIPSPNEDQLSVCLSVNSRKDSGIRSNSRRSSIQQQVLFHFSHAIVLILIFFFTLFLFSFCHTAYYSFAGSTSHVCCHIHHHFLSLFQLHHLFHLSLSVPIMPLHLIFHLCLLIFIFTFFCFVFFVLFLSFPPPHY